MKLQIDPIEVRVRMARQQMTQKMLAEKAKVSSQTVSSGMNGKSLTPAIVGRLSTALGCELNEIIIKKYSG